MGKVDRVKARTKARKKRRFHGNRFTCPQPEPTPQEEVIPPEENPDIIVETPSTAATAVSLANEDNSDNLRTPEINEADNLQTTPVKPNNVSYSNVLPIATDTPRQSDPEITGYRLIDVEILSQALKALCCPECQCEQHVTLRERFAEKKGVCLCVIYKV